MDLRIAVLGRLTSCGTNPTPWPVQAGSLPAPHPGRGVGSLRLILLAFFNRGCLPPGHAVRGLELVWEVGQAGSSQGGPGERRWLRGARGPTSPSLGTSGVECLQSRDRAWWVRKPSVRTRSDVGLS
jgi:hypothetical protein